LKGNDDYDNDDNFDNDENYGNVENYDTDVRLLSRTFLLLKWESFLSQVFVETDGGD